MTGSRAPHLSNLFITNIYGFFPTYCVTGWRALDNLARLRNKGYHCPRPFSDQRVYPKPDKVGEPTDPRGE